MDRTIEAKYQKDRPSTTAHLLALAPNFQCPTETGEGCAGHFLDWAIHFSRLVSCVLSDKQLGLDTHKDAAAKAKTFITTWQNAKQHTTLPDAWYNWRKGGRNTPQNKAKHNEGTERRLGQHLESQYQPGR